MINIYNSTETNFKHNGLAILDNCIICEVEEELNGFYGLELEYPIFDTKSKYLVEDNIIKASTPTGLQLFRIYRKIKNMSSITVYARHIFYDLLDNFIESYRTGNVDGNTALQGILSNTQYPINFKGFSDITTIADAFYVRKNPIGAIIGEEKNSFINRWGGELKRDNFNIFINNSIGKNNGVVIAYAKNLLGIEEDLDMSEVVTRIMPTGLTENDQVVMLEEKYIDSPLINKYPFPKIKHIHFGGDIKADTEKGITIEDVKKQLREKVQELYQVQHIDIPKANYKVDFIELSKTEEYKNYKVLETVNIGDIVTVKHKKLGIDIRQKVIKYRWDCILEKYLDIELGTFKEDLATDFNNLSNSIEEIKENVEENNKQFRSKFEQTDEKIEMTVEEVNKTKAQLTITASEIRSEVQDTERNLNSKIQQTADTITLIVNDQINNVNSKIEQQANKINLVVDGSGNINSTNIALAIKDNYSAIDMLADVINIIPHNGVINFSNGTSIDTRDSSGQNRDNFIRLRADNTHYVCVDGNSGAIGLYFPGYGGSHAYWTFTKDALYKDGVKVL